MSNGDVRIINCISNEGNSNENTDSEICEQQINNQENGNKDDLMTTVAIYKNVHKQASSKTICLMENDIYSGSETGQIVRIQPASRSTHAVRPFADDLMGVTHLRTCDQFLMLSAHSTGQIHLWDVRKRPQSPDFGIEPLNSRPVTGLNNSITAIATHPTQLNVGIGTHDGVVSFIDLRQSNEPLPIAFRVSQEPVTEIKFHPLYSNNCFSLSESSLIHWDGTLLSREINKTIYSSPNNEGINGVSDHLESELLAMEMDEEDERRNIWLSARASTNMQLRVLIEGEPRLLSTFDIVEGALVAGSHTAELILLKGIHFGN
uniref:Nucleoporin Nup43 n=1 Tax=Meloidogyne hapla TaxID=6305 RepID=A0A1I8B9Z8_MELHA